MRKILIGALILLAALSFYAEAGVRNPVGSLSFATEKEKYLPIINRWDGYYPTARLDRLAEWHVTPRGGYFGDRTAFASFWEVFKEGKGMPAVDFDKNIVVFVGGDGASQQMFIAKVAVKQGIAEVTAGVKASDSTRENGLPLALAVIPRAGIKYIRIGQQRIAVE